jgi:hypothetical protein
MKMRFNPKNLFKWGKDDIPIIIALVAAFFSFVYTPLPAPPPPDPQAHRRGLLEQV